MEILAISEIENILLLEGDKREYESIAKNFSLKKKISYSS